MKSVDQGFVGYLIPIASSFSDQICVWWKKFGRKIRALRAPGESRKNRKRRRRKKKKERHGREETRPRRPYLPPVGEQPTDRLSCRRTVSRLALSATHGPTSPCRSRPGALATRRGPASNLSVNSLPISSNRFTVGR
jgi:hypothetical protein